MDSIRALKTQLRGHNQIDRLDSGLESSQGAQEIISIICARRLVTKLILGHNTLRDQGCIELFQFLCSTPGRQYPVAEISLNSNQIGNRGLLAIADYLKDNTTLKELFLQNNLFNNEPSVTASFTNGLNTSHLETLTFTANRYLSDSFTDQFLTDLDAPHLHEVHFSAMNLSPASAPPLIAFISSPRCQLHTLKCNGNALGFRAVRSIIRAIERSNFTLAKVEMYSNHLAQLGPPGGAGSTSDTSTDEDEMGEEGGVSVGMKESENALRRALMRNAHLKRLVEREAVQLLLYARVLLLRPNRAPPALSFQGLPNELQLHILSFLSPTLSSAQCIRVCTYASSLQSLPQLLVLPTLRRIKDISTPSSGSSYSPNTSKNLFPSRNLSVGGRHPPISVIEGKNSVDRIHEDRSNWLMRVGCLYYEREGSFSDESDY